MYVHYLKFFILSSFIRLLFIIPNTLFVMDSKLPHDGVYNDRSKASSAISIAVAEEYGLDVMQLPTSSGKSKVVFVCPSSKNYWVQHFKDWSAMSKDDKKADLDNKEVIVEFPILPAERKHDYNIQQEYHRGTRLGAGVCGFCPFYAVARKSSQDNKWQFIVFRDSDMNYRPHSTNCMCSALLQGKALREAMERTLAGNVHISGEEVKNAMTGVGTGLSVAMLGSRTSVYDAQLKLKTSDDKFYGDKWARLEIYLEELARLNPSFRVVLEKDEDNRFVRYFIGFGASIHILLSYGLNMQSIDACHSRHHIYKGPTYHFLVGRNGNNRNVTIAMTLTRSETSDSYQWMANNLMNMRGG
jgi:hypothetical protein